MRKSKTNKNPLQTYNIMSSKTALSKIAFKEGGGIFPKCINLGCDKDVGIRRPDMPPRHPSFKTECGSCQRNRSAGKKASWYYISQKRIL